MMFFKDKLPPEFRKKMFLVGKTYNDRQIHLSLWDCAPSPEQGFYLVAETEVVVDISSTTVDPVLAQVEAIQAQIVKVRAATGNAITQMQEEIYSLLALPLTEKE